jgi:hypothetical protein
MAKTGAIAKLKSMAKERNLQAGGIAKLAQSGAMDKLAKLLKGTQETLPAAETKIIQAPTVVVPSKLSNVKEAVRQSKGDYGARRVERAADEVKNLERLYREEALRRAFTGDNAAAMMTMNPRDFEKFAHPLTPVEKPWPGSGPKKETMSTDNYVKYLAGVDEFHDIPFLEINKKEQGRPLLPYISGHEGRHRSRALAERGEPSSLVQLFPRAELREPLPRRSQEDYIEALRREIEMTGNMVVPEQYSPVTGIKVPRPEIIFPDIYAKGGEVHMKKGGEPVDPRFRTAGGDPLNEFVPPRYRRAGRRPESQQDREASANIPVAVARGLVSGSLGLPADLLNLPGAIYSGVTGKESYELPFGSEYIEKRLPFRGASQTPVGELFTGAGQLAGGAYTGPLSGARAAMAVPKAVMRAGRDFFQAAGQNVSPLTVYHGSPHKFPPTAKNPLGEFDSTKIGTGEGAQAYGHGSYLAEAPGVAEDYAKTLASPRNRVMENRGVYIEPSPAGDGKWRLAKTSEVGKQIGRTGDATQGITDWRFPNVAAALRYAKKNGLIAKDQRPILTEIAEEGKYRPVRSASEMEDPLYNQLIASDPGYRYTVDLPDEKIARMLDWDKPLSQQPEVIKALKGTDYEVGMSQREAEKVADMRLRQEADEWADMTGGDPVDYSNNVDWEKYVDQVRKESGSIDSSITGKELHRMVMRDEGYRPELFDPENYQIGTSEALRGYGIPGIRYLDASSRDAGKGTSNFVVFPGEEDALTILERKKEGGEVKMQAGGIAKLKALLRAPAKSKEEIEEVARRVAPQVTGEFVRGSKGTASVAEKTQKQFAREKDLPVEFTDVKKVAPKKIISPQELKGTVVTGIPGDPTVTGKSLVKVGETKLELPSPQHGGPLYGMGRNDDIFWASGIGPAGGVQRVAKEASQAYDAPVVGQYIMMGPDSINYAQHFADANLQAIDLSKMSKSQIEEFNKLIRFGDDKSGPRPGFPGIEDKIDSYLHFSMDPHLRRHFNKLMQMPTVTEKFNLPSGQDIRYAITEAPLRNMETGVTGYSMGELSPDVTKSMLPLSAHPTYSHDIPGRFIGGLKYPTPYEMTFPDTLMSVRANPKQAGQEFGSLKMVGPRQIYDQQMIDELMMYEEAMKKYTGKKKGGKVSPLSAVEKV